VFEYISQVMNAIRLGLTMSPQTLAVLQVPPNARWVAFGLLVVAGASMLLGQSVILFVNRIPPKRFTLSLLVNGMLFVAGIFFWALMVWATGNFLLAETATYRQILLIIALSYAPLVFGFLILVPYAGPAIQVLLYVWSMLAAVRGVEAVFTAGFWASLIVVTVSFAMMYAIQTTIGRPIWAIGDRMLGIDRTATVRDQLHLDTGGPRRKGQE